MEEEKKETNTQNNKKKRNKILIIILITLILILLILVVGIRVYNRVVYGSVENRTPIIVKSSGSRDFSIDAKPIIYLYPEQTTELTVKLGKPEKITSSYPKYTNGWEVIANPDGTLIDTATGRELYSLYWEGINTGSKMKEEGFVIKGEEVANFLEEKLKILGLTDKEAEEFIIYWLPKMENNKYNYIRFASMDEINEGMPLEISQEPDTLIRILMEYKALDEYVEIKEQELTTPTRTGFVVVEWGGTELMGNF